MSADSTHELERVAATATVAGASTEPFTPLPRARVAPAWLRLPLLLGLWANLLVLGLMSCAWNLLALLLYPLLPKGLGRRIGRAGIAHGYGLYWRIAMATGMLRIDNRALDVLREERGLIVVSNHPSMLDALLLVARLPRSACIMKAELARNIFLSAGARLARYIRNDSAEGLLRCAVKDLKEGGQLVVFPEATRTVSPPINPLRGTGVMLVSKRAQAPIQTVLIDTDSPYLGKGWPLWRLPPLPIVYRVRLGRRFPPARHVNERLAEIEQYLRAQVHPCPMATTTTTTATAPVDGRRDDPAGAAAVPPPAP